jgi:hypothetical protein
MTPIPVFAILEAAKQTRREKMAGPLSDSDLLDFVMAEHLALRAFMLSVSVELANSKSNPLSWMSEFIAILHARIDVHEKSLGQTASRLPVHEMARKIFDALGQQLESILRSPPESPADR